MAILGRHRLRAQWEADRQGQWTCEVAQSLRKDYENQLKMWSSLEEDTLVRRLWERELEVVRWPQLEVWVGVLDDVHPRVNFAPPRAPMAPGLGDSIKDAPELASSEKQSAREFRRAPSQVTLNLRPDVLESLVETHAASASPGPTPWEPVPVVDFGRRLRLWSQNLEVNFPCPTWGFPLWLSSLRANWSSDRDGSTRLAFAKVPMVPALKVPQLHSLKSQRDFLLTSYREDVEAFCRVDRSLLRAKERIQFVQTRCSRRDPAFETSAKKFSSCRSAESKALKAYRELQSNRNESERKFLEKWQEWRLQAPPACDKLSKKMLTNSSSTSV